MLVSYEYDQNQKLPVGQLAVMRAKSWAEMSCCGLHNWHVYWCNALACAAVKHRPQKIFLVYDRGISVPPMLYIERTICGGWWLSGCCSSVAEQCLLDDLSHYSHFLVPLMLEYSLDVFEEQEEDNSDREERQ